MNLLNFNVANFFCNVFYASITYLVKVMIGYIHVSNTLLTYYFIGNCETISFIGWLIQ
ncbi:MAG: hypothetical protein K0S41_374 [Anaerocolumna sp.]|jgi:hypothetical protein|nr:hypothetical protein [Anaerocolumna sp.]